MALVCPYSWSRPGGVRSHVAGLADALRATGLEIDILAPADEDGSSSEIVSLGRSLPIRTNGSVQRVALGPATAPRLGRRLRTREYDLVHLHEPMIPLTCLTALVSADAPLVGTFHMQAPSPRWYRLFAPLCRRALGRLQVRIAVSEAARAHVASVCPGDYVIVPNGVELPARRREHVGPGRTVVFVGRAEPRKGLPVLIEAMRRLPPSVRLELVGVDERELAGLCNGDTQLRERITAHGYVSNEERGRRLLETDVLCAPSLGGESFGLVLAEAMAVGVPVVASDVDGYRELVADGCGRLVPPGNAPVLAASLQELLQSPELRKRMSQSARALARELEWSRVAERVFELYEEAVERAAGRGAGRARVGDRAARRGGEQRD